MYYNISSLGSNDTGSSSPIVDVFREVSGWWLCVRGIPLPSQSVSQSSKFVVKYPSMSHDCWWVIFYYHISKRN